MSSNRETNQEAYSLPRVRIFISSPGDVKKERTIVQRVLRRLQAQFSSQLFIDPFFWENEPKYAGEDYQSQIESPSKFDLFLCILWSRLGTPLHPYKYTRQDGSTYLSGTEYEFEDAISAYKESGGTPRILLFKKTVQPPEIQASEEIRSEYKNQTHALERFFKKWTEDPEFSGVLCSAVSEYEEIRAFEELITKSLEQFFLKFLDDDTSTKNVATWKGNPFRGLNYFDFEHASIFYGREKPISEIFARLRERLQAKSPFLLIGGSSGVGKSSILRAGLLPLLLRPYQDWNVTAWRYAELRPSNKRKGEDDFADVFARALLKERIPELGIKDGAQARMVLPSALPELKSKEINAKKLGVLIRKNTYKAMDYIKIILTECEKIESTSANNSIHPNVKLCIFVDQLEEILTAEDVSLSSQEHFFQFLRTLVDSGLAVVLATIRSDCLKDLEKIEDIQVLKDGNGYYNLSPPSEHNIIDIINKPAIAAGVEFETNLNNESLDKIILEDVLEYKDGKHVTTVLPLLEFALSELYEKAKNRHEQGRIKLSFADYENMQRLSGAIAQKANEAFEQFRHENIHVQSERGKELCFIRVMRKLIVKTQDMVFTRKKALRSHFVQKDEDIFISQFIAHRLLVSEVENNENYVYIVHEALLNNWDKLKDFTDNEREYFSMMQRFESSFKEWINQHEHKDFLLYEGKTLADAESLQNNFHAITDSKQLEYIRQSRAKANREKRFLQTIVVVLLLFLGGTIFGGYQAYTMYQRAEIARGDAEDLIQFMLFDLTDSLRPIGKLPLLDSINKKIDAYYEKQTTENDDSLRRKSSLLIQQGSIAQEQGKFEESIKYFKKSLNISQHLSEKDPTNTLWQRDKLMALAHIGEIYKLQGKLKKSLKYLEESLTILDTLDGYVGKAHNKDSDKLDLYLRIGDIFLALGDLQEASFYYEDALRISILMAEEEPNNLLAQERPAFAYERMGAIAFFQKNFDKALDYSEKSLHIVSNLVNLEPHNMVIKKTLALYYDKNADIHKIKKNYDKALTSYERSLKIRQQLLENDASNAEWQRNISISYERIADIYFLQKQYMKSLEYNEKSLDIVKKILQQNPSYHELKRDSAVVISRMGVTYLAQKKPNKALEHYKHSLQISKELITQDSANSLWLRTHVVTLKNLADFYGKMKNITSAFDYYEESLKFSSLLNTYEPNNQLWLDDTYDTLQKMYTAFFLRKNPKQFLDYLTVFLASTNNESLAMKKNEIFAQFVVNVGDTFLEQKKYSIALSYFQTSLQIRKQIENAFPNDNLAKRNVSISLSRIGDTCLPQGKVDEALEYFHASLAIRREISSNDPENLSFKDGIAYVLNRIGNVLHYLKKDTVAALKYKKEEEAIMKFILSKNGE